MSRRHLSCISAAATCWIAITSAGCGGGGGSEAPAAPPPPAPAPITSLTIEADAKNVGVGGTLQLRATARDAQGNVRSDAQVTWTALDPTVATVSTAGAVGGVRAGIARIRAATGSVSDEAAVSVARAYSSGGAVEVTADVDGLAHVFTPSFAGVHYSVQVRTAQGSAVPGALVGYSEQDGKSMFAIDGPDTTWASSIVFGVPDSLRARLSVAPNVALSSMASGPTVERVSLTIEIAPYQQVRLPFASDAYELAKLFFHLGADNRRCMSYAEAAAFLKTRAALVRRGALVAFANSGAAGATVLAASAIRDAGLQGADVALADKLVQIGVQRWGAPASQTVNTRVSVRSDFADPAKVGATFRRFWEALVITPNEPTCQPATPARLTILAQPTSGTAAANLSPALQVAIQDAAGNTISTATNTITVSLGQNSSGGVLSGTLSRAAVSGVATFSDLKIDRAGTYTLVVSGAGLTATSTSFVVSAPAAATGKVSAGHDHACAITAAGATYCWGRTAAWAPTGVSGLVPTLIPGGLSFDILGPGQIHSCALTTAGGAYCWGTNSNGQLGNGTTSSVQQGTPQQVAGSLVFRQLSSGSEHACGLTPAGAAHCWGRNEKGQIGDGTLGPTDRLTPVPVLGGLAFSNISGGFLTTCALTAGGSAYCWGGNELGQIGDGTLTTRLTPTPVSGGLSFTQLGTPRGYFTCGLTSAGAAHCWGQNHVGQLGDGTTTTPRTSPVPVSTALAFSSITTGGDHTCALTANGTAYCWGGNTRGQLGDGTNTSRLQPTPVVGNLTFRALAAGSFFTCGIATSGTLYCWGFNNFGQLGDGTNTARNTPAPISGGLVF